MKTQQQQNQHQQQDQHQQQQQQHRKLKSQNRPLFSCGFFRQCTTHTVLSPTTSTPTSPSLPLSPSSSAAPPPPPPPPPSHKESQPPPIQTQRRPPDSSSSSSSSSSATSQQSFTQWRVPLANSPLHHHQYRHHHHHHPPPPPDKSKPLQDQDIACRSDPPPDFQELFHVAELQLSTGSPSEQLASLHLLERALVPNPPSDPVCRPELMRGVVANLKRQAASKPATKILLALSLAEANRRVAVEAGAVGALVEVAMELEESAAERALAALELACTVQEGAAELRAHALAVPVMVSMMGKMAGRGREYAISALTIIYGNGGSGEQVQHAPPEEVARAVVLALQGDCTDRGKRKGSQLLKALQEYGRLDLSQEGNVRF